MKTFREQDRWLLKRWAKLRLLEDAMNSARQRYADLFVEVHKQVRRECPALTRMDRHLKPSEILQWGGEIVFSKPKWQGQHATWPSGIYVWGVSLDELADESAEPPGIYIWLSRNQSGRRVAALRERLAAKAPKVHRKLRLTWRHDDGGDDSRTCLWYPFPEGADGLQKLLRSGEQSFVDCMVKHVKVMAEFIPEVDRVIGNKR